MFPVYLLKTALDYVIIYSPGVKYTWENSRGERMSIYSYFLSFYSSVLSVISWFLLLPFLSCFRVLPLSILLWFVYQWLILQYLHLRLLISSFCLKDIFAGYRTLCQQFFFFQLLKISSSFLLSGLCGFQREMHFCSSCFLLWVMYHSLLVTFKTFWFEFSFQKFDQDLSWCGFLCTFTFDIYSAS